MALVSWSRRRKLSNAATVMIRLRPTLREGNSLARIKFVIVRGLTDNRLAASGTETAKMFSSFMTYVLCRAGAVDQVALRVKILDKYACHMTNSFLQAYDSKNWGENKVTLFMTISNRQAAREREQRFEALADFANLGDTPEGWRRFRSKHPHFFPNSPSGMDRPGFRNLSDWIYTFAERWAQDLADLPPDRRPVPPLLWYRNCLRTVWMRKDPRGYALTILLGFEEEAQRIAEEFPDEQNEILCRPLYIPTKSFNAAQQHMMGGLPKGNQVVKSDIIEGLPVGQPQVTLTGRIEWEFGCILQQAAYEIMRVRWRMKVCPECKRFFIAKKTAQKHCSPICYQRKKESASLEYYYREGKNRREERREVETRKRKP